MATVNLVATLDSLDQLVRTGRVPGAAGWLGRRVGLRPLVHVTGEAIRPLRPAFSRAAAVQRMVMRLRQSKPPTARLHVAVLHSNDEQGAGSLLERVTAGTECCTAFVAELGPAMVAYAGPGVLGVAWRWETR